MHLNDEVGGLRDAARRDHFLPDQGNRADHYRAGRERRVRVPVRGGGRKILRRCADHAGEDLIPDAVGPAVNVAVANKELLLRAVYDSRARSLRVRYKTTACKVRAAVAVVHQRNETIDLNTPHRRCLRNGPEFRMKLATGPTRHIDGQVR